MKLVINLVFVFFFCVSYAQTGFDKKKWKSDEPVDSIISYRFIAFQDTSISDMLAGKNTQQVKKILGKPDWEYYMKCDGEPDCKVYIYAFMGKDRPSRLKWLFLSNEKKIQLTSPYCFRTIIFKNKKFYDTLTITCGG